MTRQAQTTIDGYTIQHQRARMTGSMDLEDADAKHFITGDVIVAVIVGKIEGPTIKEDRHGDITRTSVTKVTDVRVLTGALKKVMVDQLGLVGSDTVDFPMVSTPAVVEMVAAQPEVEDLPLEDEVHISIEDAPYWNDEEILAQEDVFIAPPPPQVEVVGNIRDRDFESQSQGPLTLGQVRQTRDPRLARFLNEVQ